MQGQAVCSNYSMYGICKYGPTCRYDHPFVGYPFNYGVSLPPLSILDSSLMTHHVIQTAPSESSPAMSSKVPEWVQNSDAPNGKHQNPRTKNSSTVHSEDSPEEPHSPSPSVQDSSEPSNDQN